MPSNIVTVALKAGCDNRTDPLYQYDYGQVLQLLGVDLPEAYEVHFSNSPRGEAKTAIGDEDGVIIPDEYLLTGAPVYAWLYLHTGETDGETEYRIIIPVIARAKPTDAEPTPVQQDAITQAIAALNRAVEETAQSADDAAGSATAAETALSGAQAAQTAAEASAAGAATSASESAQSATRAATSAQAASNSASDAAQSASAASGSADEAERYADLAEQAAAEKGYMWFYIDESGALIYQHTSNTEVDFYISDGDLYVKAVS